MDPEANGYITISTFNKFLRKKRIVKDQYIYYIHIYIRYEGIEIVKSITRSPEEIMHVRQSQFTYVFVKPLFKGSLDNLYSFISNLNFKSQVLPIGLRILQYQRCLYLLGVSEVNERANQGKDILNALTQYHNINAEDATVGIEKIIMNEMEVLIEKMKERIMNTEKEMLSPEFTRENTPKNKMEFICKKYIVYCIYIYM